MKKRHPLKRVDRPQSLYGKPSGRVVPPDPPMDPDVANEPIPDDWEDYVWPEGRPKPSPADPPPGSL